jgi:DNA-binding beta-propeller fold protein YncE
LRAVAFPDGRKPTVSVLSVPGRGAFSALLLSPDEQTLYAVDFTAQVINVVDPDENRLLRSVPFGRDRFKRPLCAAALSPGGDRLYLLANADGTHGDGILAFDTASWRPVGHFLPGRDRLYCLAVSADGGSLYASTASDADGGEAALLTLDARSGEEQRRVALNLETGCCPFLTIVTDSSQEVATPMP